LAVTFSDSLRFQDVESPADAARLRLLFAENEDALRAFSQRLEALQSACAGGNALQPWASAIFPVADAFAVFVHCAQQPLRGWECSLRVADLTALRRQGLELPLESVLPNHSAFAKWACVDELFLKTFRSAGFFVCLAPENKLLCRAGEGQRPLAEAALADLLCHAVPPQHRRFVSAAIGTGELPREDYALLVSVGGDPPELRGSNGATVDLEAEPPTLGLTFQRLNFSQRSARALLSRLDLPFLVSMWNAAEQMVAEALGSRETAGAQDLVTWLMLRKNFASHKYAITEEEHMRLQRLVKAFHEQG
jgi:hypothetical protein